VVTQTLVAEGEGLWHEYVGGYSDWVQQRRPPPPVRGAAPARRRERGADKPPPAPARKRLSSWEQRELDALPAELEALEREQHALTERMCAPDYHREGTERIKADRTRAEEIERLLAAKFERWGELDARA
jgi:ATP-binding cassette subfamily F protein uup